MEHGRRCLGALLVIIRFTRAQIGRVQSAFGDEIGIGPGTMAAGPRETKMARCKIRLLLSSQFTTLQIGTADCFFLGRDRR